MRRKFFFGKILLGARDAGRAVLKAVLNARRVGRRRRKPLRRRRSRRGGHREPAEAYLAHLDRGVRVRRVRGGAFHLHLHRRRRRRSSRALALALQRPRGARVRRAVRVVPRAVPLVVRVGRSDARVRDARVRSRVRPVRGPGRERDTRVWSDPTVVVAGVGKAAPRRKRLQSRRLQRRTHLAPVAVALRPFALARSRA